MYRKVNRAYRNTVNRLCREFVDGRMQLLGNTDAIWQLHLWSVIVPSSAREPTTSSPGSG